MKIDVDGKIRVQKIIQSCYGDSSCIENLVIVKCIGCYRKLFAYLFSVLYQRKQLKDATTQCGKTPSNRFSHRASGAEK